MNRAQNTDVGNATNDFEEGLARGNRLAKGEAAAERIIADNDAALAASTPASELETKKLSTSEILDRLRAQSVEDRYPTSAAKDAAVERGALGEKFHSDGIRKGR